ncbi:hypothetical protein [Nocardioides alcanivorans]|uniref:hypothetical protein n=1 Tax=Nocardioides alcanivorans TaxID=2897352 RepID=UPI001F3BD7D0|nr:hypothetical protein [Nocardioides alcanivorans]
MARYPLSFAERNKVIIALGGIAALVTVFLLTFNASSLPVIGNGDTYTAEFAESGGFARATRCGSLGSRSGR